MQKNVATRDEVDKYLDRYVKRVTTELDANDFLYAVSASRNYDPSPALDKITAPVMFINSADDCINPPELGIAERAIKKVKMAASFFYRSPIKRTVMGLTPTPQFGNNI